MNAKQRAKRRNLINYRMMDGPYIHCAGRMDANLLIKFKADPWQIFRKGG